MRSWSEKGTKISLSCAVYDINNDIYMGACLDRGHVHSTMVLDYSVHSISGLLYAA